MWGCRLRCSSVKSRFPVTGFDIDEKKIDTLNSGGSYIVRIPPAEIARAQANGFRATADYDELSAMDAILICVPTPLNEYHEPDLSFITGTVTAIAPRLRAGQLVVLESTTYPGTTEEVVIPLLEGNPRGLKVSRAGAGGEDASWWPSLRSGKIRATRRSRAAIFRRWWAV